MQQQYNCLLHFLQPPINEVVNYPCDKSGGERDTDGRVACRWIDKEGDGTLLQTRWRLNMASADLRARWNGFLYCCPLAFFHFLSFCLVSAPPASSFALFSPDWITAATALLRCSALSFHPPLANRRQLAVAAEEVQPCVPDQSST